jgi:hypothetical protein
MNMMKMTMKMMEMMKVMKMIDSRWGGGGLLIDVMWLPASSASSSTSY